MYFCLRLVHYSDVMTDRHVLWKNRHYLYDIPQALPKVLLAVQSWDWSTLNGIYGLLNEWKPMEAVDALELLLPWLTIISS